jgi:hypothetical protein
MFVTPDNIVGNNQHNRGHCLDMYYTATTMQKLQRALYSKTSYLRITEYHEKDRMVNKEYFESRK